MKTGHPYIAGGTPEQREITYRHITRRWWWRGFFAGTAIGLTLGLSIIALLAWLTGNI